MVDFEPINTKDKSVQYRLKVKTERNNSRLNNHQPIQLSGWRANCDIQIIIDHHACVEYLSKYAAKGEPRSPMLKDTLNSVINHDDSSPSTKVIKRLMMKSIGERDFSTQETMHLLLSLNLHSSNLKVVPINLNGSRKIQTNLSSEHKCTQDSLLDVYVACVAGGFLGFLNFYYRTQAEKIKEGAKRRRGKMRARKTACRKTLVK